MSKNTRDTKFRKVDVDQYDEDTFQDECIEDGNQISFNENEINSLLTSGRNVDALKQVLASAPINSKDQGEKDTVFRLVSQVMLTFKSSQIEEAVNKLDDSSIDLLMKYIYRAFEQPAENSHVLLLTWHEKVFARGKLGCIVRVLTDRKRV